MKLINDEFDLLIKFLNTQVEGFWGFGVLRKRSKNWSLLDRFGYVDNMILISDHVIDIPENDRATSEICSPILFLFYSSMDLKKSMEE